MDKLDDKTTIFDLETFKKSVRKEIENDIREEVEFNVYYDLFLNMPVSVLCEQFVSYYKPTSFSFDSLDEVGFCLMYAIVDKTCKYLLSGRSDWFSILTDEN